MAEAVEDAFRYDRLVLASITYSGDMFPFMTTFIHTLAEHAYQNRKVAFIESGTWAPVAAKAMRAQVEQMAGIEFAETVVTVRGSVDEAARAQIAALATELSEYRRWAVSLNSETLLLHAAGHNVVAGAAFFGNGCEETVAARKVKAVKTTLR